jgi:hypothetical protein
MTGDANPPAPPAAGSYVSEWFGHRVFPTVVGGPEALADQRTQRCPFLSRATGDERQCIKAAASRGVCTINCPSNGSRQDWLVCPYRAFSPEIVETTVRRLFGLRGDATPLIQPAINLSKPEVRDQIRDAHRDGHSVFVYFDSKVGGELGIPSTRSSPEFSFDVTFIELIPADEGPQVGRFGILEIQTMDFHGSYKAAVNALRNGLDLFPHRFHEVLRDNVEWMGRKVEGPNIANVFKRTFYQMMFKFQLGTHARCAGCVLAIPQAVWGSWQRHLGAPTLLDRGDGTRSLAAPAGPVAGQPPAWIFVFDPEILPDRTPSPIVIRDVIATDVPAIAHWALDVAPQAAIANIGVHGGLLSMLSKRLQRLWPELARTIVVEGAPERRPRRRRPRDGV